jgi:hypothetical protein
VSAIEQALLAVMAAHDGDPVTAKCYILQAQQETREAARRERQLVDIAALVVAGHRQRAAGLALEHTTAFPGDAELLVRMAPEAR